MLLLMKNTAVRHISQNKVRYFFLILCLLAGMVAGVFFVGVVSEEQSAELSLFINSFSQQTVNQSVLPSEIFIASALSNLRMLCLIFICGLFFVFTPIVYGLVAVKGFGIGFTTGFLSFYFGFKGFMLSMVSILPQCIFSIPALIYVAFCAIRYASEKRRKNKTKAISSKNDETQQFKRFTYYFLAGGSILLLSSVIDAFIVPVFVKSICALFV